MESDLKYIVLQTKYRKLHENADNIFPKEWFNVKEYALKKMILKECIARKCLIKESENYLNFRKIAIN